MWGYEENMSSDPATSLSHSDLSGSLPDMLWVRAICALGFGLSFLAHLCLTVPPSLKCPAATKILGRYTYLTVQSNVLCFCYHALRLVAPQSFVAVHGYPLAFALGFTLTVLYYGLNYFMAARVADDKLWKSKGYEWLPLACHLEHGMALPLALLDALYGGHAGTTTSADVVVWISAYVAAYLSFTWFNKSVGGVWVYPIFDAFEAKLGGSMGFWMLGGPVALAYVGVGFLGQHLSG